jgi:hypothetical protein
LAVPEPAEPILSSRPAESAISEGNLVENPLFVLTNKEARPLDENGEIRLADYEKVVHIGLERVGTELAERRVVMNASPKYGFPTMFAYRLLLAVIQRAQQAGFGGPKVFIGRHEIATALGYSRPSSAVYADIENACFAMTAMTIEFGNTWYERREGHHRGRRGGAHLINEFDFQDERLGGSAGGRSHVTLGDLLFDSLRAGYFHGVDLRYMNALKSPLAQRLYAYLTKKDHQKLGYCEGIREIAAKLNLKKRKPSAILKALGPALDLLQREVPVAGSARPRRFIGDWRFDERLLLRVTFFREPAEQGQLVLAQLRSLAASR